MKQYLVLKPVILEIDKLQIKNLHENGNIYLSYNKKEDAEKASQNGKYRIYELGIDNKPTNK